MSAIFDKFQTLYEQQEGGCWSCGRHLKSDGSNAEFIVVLDQIVGLECKDCKQADEEE